MVYEAVYCFSVLGYSLSGLINYSISSWEFNESSFGDLKSKGAEFTSGDGSSEAESADVVRGRLRFSFGD